MKIIYDFDGTLTPKPVPKFKLLEKCGINDDEYYHLFSELKEHVIKNNLNIFEFFYQTYLDILKESNIKPTKNNLAYGSDDIEYNKGLIEYFKYLEKFGVENYLLSSGIKEYLKNTKIAKYFTNIYGTTFKKENNEYVIDYLMTDENKVNIIKDISHNDCSDIIYIGDGLTDLPAMEYVKKNGGISIFLVHDKEIISNIDTDRFISYYFEPDYSKDSSLFRKIDEILKNSLRK